MIQIFREAGEKWEDKDFMPFDLLNGITSEPLGRSLHGFGNT